MNTSICKYCRSEILWENRRPMNPDHSHHSFEFCQAVRKEAKLAKAREKRAALREQKAKWQSLQALAPIGSYLVCKNRHPYTGEEYYRPIGKVIYHCVHNTKDLIQAHTMSAWQNLGVIKAYGCPMFFSYPPTMHQGLECVDQDRYLDVSAAYWDLESKWMNRERTPFDREAEKQRLTQPDA